MTEDQEKMIEKIKGLIAISQDKDDDAEGQSAFLLAQKLMVKYKIERADLEAQEEALRISDFAITPYKKLFWWEKQLACVIADNFRVRCYIRSEKRVGDAMKKSCVVFYGQSEDWEVAQAIFNLAVEQLQFFCKNYSQKLKSNYSISEIKNSYRLGFISGLESAFTAQKGQSTELMNFTLISPEVSQQWENRAPQMKKTEGVTPSVDDMTAFYQGYLHGEQLDLAEKKGIIYEKA